MITDAISSNSQANMNVGTATTSAGKAQAPSSETVHDTPEQSLFDTKDTVEISDEARALSSAEKAVETTPLVVDNTDAIATSVEADHSTREGRDAEGKKYDEILKELRDKYGEEEAMKRFNEIMKDEGFEIQEKIGSSVGQILAQGTLGGMNFTISSGFGWNLSPKTHPELYAAGGMTFAMPGSSNYNTYSSVAGQKTSQGVQYQTSTWAVYNAFDMSNYSDTIDKWKNQNTELLTQESGFDVDEYVDNLDTPSAETFSAESVNADLGALVKDILSSSGYAINPDQSISIYLTANEHGVYTGLSVNGNFDDDSELKDIQNIFNAALKNDPEILKSFIAEYNSLELFDVNQLADSFNSDGQSLKFSQARHFVYSGSQPDAVVMGSSLFAQATGYVYQKKISDEFDANSDQAVVSMKNAGSTYDKELADNMAEIAMSLNKQYQ